MGERAFTKFQYGKESAAAHGTPVAATKMLLAEPKEIPSDRKPVFVEDATGLRARSYRSYIPQYLAQNTIQIPQAYFQALPMLLSCAIKGNITPTETTPSQADYKWPFTPALGAANAPDSITLEMGDDTQAYELEYLMFQRLKIAFQIAQGAEESAVAIEAEYFARQVTPAAFTAALSLPTVETMNGKLARFYLDATWAGVGGTEKTGLLRAGEIEILTGVHPKFMGGANKYFDVHGEGDIAVMATFTLEGNAVADLIWDAMRAQDLAVWRIDLSGAQIGTGTNHNLKLDVGGRWEEVVPLSEADKGNNLHKAIFHGMYDPTGAKLLQLECTTNQNTI